MQHGLSATSPAPMSIIFETKDVNRFLHAYNSEKFRNFCAVGFPGPKNSLKYGTLGWCLSVRRTAQTTQNVGDGSHLGG